ncbi:MAG: hypothetical protein IPG46_07130 [Actinobacteria bacterium]|nr:hypothetical protein [Actinomycetota bacterium]
MHGREFLDPEAGAEYIPGAEGAPVETTTTGDRYARSGAPSSTSATSARSTVSGCTTTTRKRSSSRRT